MIGVTFKYAKYFQTKGGIRIVCFSKPEHPLLSPKYLAQFSSTFLSKGWHSLLPKDIRPLFLKQKPCLQVRIIDKVETIEKLPQVKECK